MRTELSLVFLGLIAGSDGGHQKRRPWQVLRWRPCGWGQRALFAPGLGSAWATDPGMGCSLVELKEQLWPYP